MCACGCNFAFCELVDVCWLLFILCACGYDSVFCFECLCVCVFTRYGLGCENCGLGMLLNVINVYFVYFISCVYGCVSVFLYMSFVFVLSV